MNGTVGNGAPVAKSTLQSRDMIEINLQLKQAAQYNTFHGDELIGDKRVAKGILESWRNSAEDFKKVLKLKNLPAVGRVAGKLLTGGGLDMQAGASLIGSLSNDSHRRAALIESQVKAKYDRMLHPPLTYLGDAFQYRSADGKFNSVLHPHLGQAGAPYAKTVPSKTHPLGALPDPGDLFDCLMAREEGGRESNSGLSSMLIYHATIIIHDIFRTNDKDKNISDSSSYLDLSPLYGYTEEMQRKVRDDRYGLGLLKPDAFAEDRLLRQPPGVCIMLVMYNRYHNYAATQLRRINENGRFSVPEKFGGKRLIKLAEMFVPANVRQGHEYKQLSSRYKIAWDNRKAKELPIRNKDGSIPEDSDFQEYTDLDNFIIKEGLDLNKVDPNASGLTRRAVFEAEFIAAWKKLDDDLFNTARLITCGMYIQVSIHDYLRALMGFHQFDTNFTLDPRVAMNDHKEVTRGLGNQVTVEFNLLYRFHCAISLRDEKYTEEFMREMLSKTQLAGQEPADLGTPQFMAFMQQYRKYAEDENAKCPKEVWQQTFGLKAEGEHHFDRNSITGLFDDQKMINCLTKAMDDPISNFGPRNVPKALKAVEIMGILQARKWGIGTLNDFREFFNMPRHDTFESITGNADIQDALRDLYEHPDKVELYPGVFCESDAKMGMDPGPSDVDSALWAAIFSDAITLVRSDRFYTVDWNTNSLTSWGMKEVTPDNDVCKTSVFHRILQRAFPGWFPYDSVRFFHPFYTSQTNAKFAQEQGYQTDFKITAMHPVKDFNEYSISPKFDVTGSNPTKPQKPVYLADFESIHAVLSTYTDKFIHPAVSEFKYLPAKFGEILKPKSIKKNQKEIKEDTRALMDHFMSLTRDIIKRESLIMDRRKGVYQLDMTRDLAIPVITRYVADFLGVGHLIKGPKNLKAPYSENEIYRHITNCQVFLSYNADETKMLKRRLAFRKSVQFLYQLAKSGHISRANRMAITRALLSLGHAEPTNPVSALGYQVAQNVLEEQPDISSAAATFLLIALDVAYNNVTAFTAVLNAVMNELYDQPSRTARPAAPESSRWQKIQELSFEEAKKAEAEETLCQLILEIGLANVKLPIIRQAKGDGHDVIIPETGKALVRAKDGQTIICDIPEAQRNYNERTKGKGETRNLADYYLDLQMHFTHNYAHHHPKRLGLLAVAAMIKTVAQMKNVRRAHDSQGLLKRVRLDASTEGYSNFMAPLRVKQIAYEAEKRNATDVYDTTILSPLTETYLTPEWDEMIPYPTTWKLRFDGFGRSTIYKWDKVPVLDSDKYKLPDFFPPFYQPQGPSHIGGSFASPQCKCESANGCSCKTNVTAAASCDTPAPQIPPFASDLLRMASGGCGVPAV